MEFRTAEDVRLEIAMAEFADREARRARESRADGPVDLLRRDLEAQGERIAGAIAGLAESLGKGAAGVADGAVQAEGAEPEQAAQPPRRRRKVLLRIAGDGGGDGAGALLAGL